ncbi:hypothetical protein [uncultured Treponema sp.]|uniref:hypothetical protein n=1 Tax=uncultured Treponema sp. TaxID=162155 RepID=UPI0025976CEE|nr:hypothetical protein [uncultured Treponema sp.]
MLKLRNAVLTALLAFCLAMPFVSCSFNDSATGDVSDKVTVQSDNNQNGGNENPSGGDNGGSGHEHPSGGDNGGNENPSGGNNGGSGNEKPTDPTEPGAGTTYVVIYNGDIIEESLPESKWSYGVEKVKLEEDVDYTMRGNEITLTDSGFQKVLPLLGDSGGDGGHGVIPPVTNGPVTDGSVTDGTVPDVPVPDVPGVEGTMYTVKYGDTVIVPAMPESELSHFETVLTKDTDYTIDGNVITLTEAGYAKVQDAMAGEGGEPGTNEPSHIE